MLADIYWILPCVPRKDPMGLAASVLYLSSFNVGEHVIQSKIADAAGVTEVTLRNRFKDLRSKLQLLN